MKKIIKEDQKGQKGATDQRIRRGGSEKIKMINKRIRNQKWRIRGSRRVLHDQCGARVHDKITDKKKEFRGPKRTIK